MSYFTTRPDWNIETTHPTDEPDGDIPICEQCADYINPTIAFAVDWGSLNHQHAFTDSNGDAHAIVVRAMNQ